MIYDQKEHCLNCTSKCAADCSVRLRKNILSNNSSLLSGPCYKHTCFQNKHVDQPHTAIFGGATALGHLASQGRIQVVLVWFPCDDKPAAPRYDYTCDSDDDCDDAAGALVIFDDGAQHCKVMYPVIASTTSPGNQHNCGARSDCMGRHACQISSVVAD